MRKREKDGEREKMKREKDGERNRENEEGEIERNNTYNREGER